MKETVVYTKSKGFTPLSFINQTEKEWHKIASITGFESLLDSNNQDIAGLKKSFLETNDSIANENLGYTKCNLNETDISNEIKKVVQNVKYAKAFLILDIDTNDWLNAISEYLVYLGFSITSIAGESMYWKILKSFFEEKSTHDFKFKRILEFISERNSTIASHPYMEEVDAFNDVFPFKPLGIERFHMYDIASLLEIYPFGKLNCYMLKQFPEIPNELCREKIITHLYDHLEVALNNFKTEELWQKGGSKEVMSFLTACTVHENKLTNHELLAPCPSEFTLTIRTWLDTQIELIHKLSEIEQLKDKIKPSPIIKAEPSKKSKHHAKYYALYIRLLEQIGKEMPFVKDENDRFPKAQIEKFAHNRFSGISTLQFYNHYRELEDMSNKISIARSYPNYKNIMTDISQNDADILFLLKGFPN